MNITAARRAVRDTLRHGYFGGSTLWVNCPYCHSKVSVAKHFWATIGTSQYKPPSFPRDRRLSEYDQIGRELFEHLTFQGECTKAPGYQPPSVVYGEAVER